MKKLTIALILIVTAGGLLFAGGSKESGKKTTLIKVGTEGAYPPYNFVDSSGKVDGYDMAVVRAAAELLPEYTFEFVPTAWDGIFVALEGGEFDLIASNIAWRKEREEKYYLSTVPYLWGGLEVIFKAGRQDIRSLADLSGKKVAAGVGTNTTTALEDHIRKTGLKIEIVYTDGNIANALTEIETGRVDATISSIITTQLTAESLGIKIDGITISEWPVQAIHFLYPKTEKGRLYRDRIDEALRKLLANGTLTALSKQYLFGKDYSTKEAVESGR